MRRERAGLSTQSAPQHKERFAFPTRPHTRPLATISPPCAGAPLERKRAKSPAPSSFPSSGASIDRLRGHRIPDLALPRRRPFGRSQRANRIQANFPAYAFHRGGIHECPAIGGIPQTFNNWRNSSDPRNLRSTPGHGSISRHDPFFRSLGKCNRTLSSAYGQAGRQDLGRDSRSCCTGPQARRVLLF